ncbi:trypsin-like serine protease [Streptomyces collinus]|uniref:trypsin-like serine protease n=1 Tax=Streptomyces collinus TaxID=42684 RepID=UPI00331B7A1B
MRRSSGSGYLISPRLVLTARHVVIEKRTDKPWARIKANVGHPHRLAEIERRNASVCWVAPEAGDVALLELDAPVAVPGLVRWGLPDGADPIPYGGVGFPLQSRAANGERLVEQLGGLLRPLAGGSGINDLYVLDQDAGPEMRSDGNPPWGGVSGAAVFCRDLLVGVVVYDNKAHKNRRLHAVPAHTFVTDAAFVKELDQHGVRKPLLMPVDARPPVPVSGYLWEVKQLAAEPFEGRQAELREMAAFCTAVDENGSAYWRWLAPAWSGKTTLMTQFALEPPSGLDVLAFFVTRRQLGRSDHTAFLAALQAQLREYLHDPDLLCSSQGQFLQALARASEQATLLRRRLVLLVDGLDEDTGVPDGSSGHSIAALLPRRPPPGLSIIVAGRPDPPIPSDVPETHPLRGTAIDHALGVSPAARVAKQVAQRALKELWDGPWLGRELACLTAAAGGGLSATDLARMARKQGSMGSEGPAWETWEIEETLGGAAGRSFQRRPAQWTAIGSDALFALGHDELHNGVLARLPDSALDEYRVRVHTYVERWQDAGWPIDTPEYALVGYPVLLRQLGDTRRLTALATSQARHARLWRATGSDAQALSEIADTFRLQLASAEPNLQACIRLAHRRDALRERASRIPDALITAWAQLGHPRRAIALAQSANDPARLAYLLPQILAIDSQPNTVALAAAAARTITSAQPQSLAMVTVARVMAKSGHIDDAIALAHTITTPSRQAEALVGVVHVMAKSGRIDEAIALARTISRAGRQAHALVGIVRAMAKAGRVDDALALARTIPCQDPLVRALAGVALSMFLAGRADEASALVHEAIVLARTITDSGLQARALAGVARVIARIGRTDEATLLVRTITDPELQVGTAAEIARLTARAGRADEASALVHEAIVLARTITDSGLQARALARVAGVIARIGRTDEATILVHTISDHELKARALVEIARVNIRAGRADNAAAVAIEASMVGRSIEGLSRGAQVLAIVARTLAEAGRVDEATVLTREASTLARTINNRSRRAQALAIVARTLAEAGCVDEATVLAREASTLARTAKDRSRQFEALVGVARAMAESGRLDEAVSLANTIRDRSRQSEALVGVARAMAESGRIDDAISLAYTNPTRQSEALVGVARAMAESGRTDDAISLACSITDPHRRPEALVGVARAMAESGRIDDAVSIAQTIAHPELQASVLISVVRLMASVGQIEKATFLSRSITSPDRRLQALLKVALGAARTGRVDDAVTLVNEAADLAHSITVPERHGRSMLGVVRAMASVGRVDEATVLAGTIADPDRQAEGLVGVARMMASVGRVDEAIVLAGTITVPDRQAEGLVGIGRVLAYADRFEEAVAIVSAIPNSKLCAESLVNLLPVARGSDQVKNLVGRITALAGALAHPDHRAQIMAAMARTLAENGRTADAIVVARDAAALAPKSTSLEVQADTMMIIASTLSECGCFEDAVDVARSINNPDRQAAALISIAGTLAKANRIDEDVDLHQEDERSVGQAIGSPAPRVLLAEALSVGTWLLAAGAVARLAPEALAELISVTVGSE